MSNQTPFHSGETLVQTRMGVREMIEPFARRVVRDHMPEQHREFYAQLPFLVIAARDHQGSPWATMVAAVDGVARSPDPRTLVLTRLPLSGDALAHALAPGDDVGVLGIEFHTRRRNRVNGRIAERSADGLRLQVEQSFGNCPQYIQARDWEVVDDAPVSHAQLGARLDARQCAWIRQADTFFVASGYRGEGEHPAHGMDASHRGGPPGFVRVLDDQTIAWPDYPGNNHYNTLGNLVVDPGIGLLFVDFITGSMLQISGKATLDWTPDQARWPGTQRVIEVHVQAVVAHDGALPLRWRAPSQLGLVVDDIVEECNGVRSLWLKRADGAPLPPFRAGQHLPITVSIDGGSEERSYSLSSSPDDPRWRISVKHRDGGHVSSHLHARVNIGAKIQSGLPSGQFTIDAEATSLVFIGAGIGVTPLVSMLAEAAPVGRDITFINVARDGAAAPLMADIESYAHFPNVRLHRILTRPTAEDLARNDMAHAGRLSLQVLDALLPKNVADFYLCGPVGFVKDIETWLLEIGAASARIQIESFG
jgi:ferredoxin-NADP reductase/predicted pyridoxine 5'-phosphate oxidase superfamily flavin-nucleotide-binding protein